MHGNKMLLVMRVCGSTTQDVAVIVAIYESTLRTRSTLQWIGSYNSHHQIQGETTRWIQKSAA